MSVSMRVRIAAIVLTKNEERDLPDCLRTLGELGAEVYVIDSGSADATVSIAQEHGATVLTHPFVNYSRQFNWAIDNISTRADWIFRVDADERLHPDLTRELLGLVPQLPAEVTGLWVPRRIRFMGRDLHFGGTYPVWLLRLWRNGAGRCEDLWMDEHIVLNSGRTERLRGDLIHDIPKDLTEWTVKHNWYASRECQDVASREAAAALGGQAGTKRWLKQNVYLRLPLFYRALFYWFYRYVLRLGFLDGRQGLVYHFLQGFWYRFLVDAKLYEASVRSRAGGGERVAGRARRLAK
jgi:glycosyltransferase involved in cell wall biosynthesis